MRKTAIVLAVVLGGGALVLLGWEFYALTDPNDDVALITTVVRAATQQMGCILAFIAGLLIGGLAVHFWW